MKKYTSKSYRRLGIRRTDSPKDPVVRRNYPPGIHGPKGRKRITEYGSQLAEKQKAKVVYNLAERQFRKYYETANRRQGDTGQILLQLLELRLDNVIYRLGLAKTRPQARQMVNHGFFLVNNKKVDIPSYQVKPKDEITIKTQKSKSKLFDNLTKALEKHETPAWLFFDPKELKAKVLGLPKPEEAEGIFNPRLIVEFYSK